LIWIPNSLDGRDASIVNHIERVIAESCGESLALDDDLASELAQAVAEFMEQHHDSGAYVDSGYLVMLASRALSALGRTQAAHRLLLFGSGLVRPAEWEFVGGCEVWTLDLKQITVKHSAMLEIVFFNGLNIVLSSVSEVWEKSSGCGVLGLRHVCRTATELLGGGSRQGVAALADEIKSRCRDKLAQIGAERNWKSVPEVVNLDL